jgi:hypothetical protein
VVDPSFRSGDYLGTNEPRRLHVHWPACSCHCFPGLPIPNAPGTFPTSGLCLIRALPETKYLGLRIRSSCTLFTLPLP